MNAEIHQLRPRPAAIHWMCSSCGEDASCNCGAPLMSKSQQAAQAIAADPHKSNRAISEETGISEPTVRRARTASSDAVDHETRIGLDGKARRMPRRDEEEFSEKELSSRDRGSFLLRIQEAKNFAFYAGKVDEKLLEFARGTAAAWCDLVEKMESKL